jgi:hypothetical protein
MKARNPQKKEHLPRRADPLRRDVVIAASGTAGRTQNTELRIRE